MALNVKTAAIVIGAVFILVGIIGFVPNPLVSPTGIFAANAAHNLVHLLSGLVILVSAFTALGAATGLKIIGIVYALVAILGLFSSGNMLLGIVQVNHADHWLHVALAAVILWAGFMLPEDAKA